MTTLLDLLRRSQEAKPEDLERYDRVPIDPAPPVLRRKKKKLPGDYLEAPRDKELEESTYGAGVQKGKRMMDLLRLQEYVDTYKEGMI